MVPPGLGLHMLCVCVCVCVCACMCGWAVKCVCIWGRNETGGEGDEGELGRGGAYLTSTEHRRMPCCPPPQWASSQISQVPGRKGLWSLHNCLYEPKKQPLQDRKRMSDLIRT